MTCFIKMLFVIFTVERQFSDVCNSNICDNYIGYKCIPINGTGVYCEAQCFDEKWVNTITITPPMQFYITIRINLTD
jgi:hypothetical protein